jgi:hypothetical protein
MWKLKGQGRDANSRGWRRYFYRGIRNRARSRLIVVGAPTQREAHARAKHLGQVTRRELQAFSTRKWCSASGPSRTLLAVSTIELPAVTPRASFPSVHGGGRDRNAVVTVSQDFSPTRYNNGSRKSRGVGGLSKLTQLTRIHLEQALNWSN